MTVKISFGTFCLFPAWRDQILLSLDKGKKTPHTKLAVIVMITENSLVTITKKAKLLLESW